MVDARTTCALVSFTLLFGWLGGISVAQQVENRVPFQSSAESDRSKSLDDKIARIGATANWRFVTRDFVEIIEKRQSELRGAEVTVLGVLRDEENRPVEGAFALLRLASNSSIMRVKAGQTTDVFAVAWSDAMGVFKFRSQATPWFEPMYPINWELCVYAPGFAIETRRYQYLDGQIRKERMQLQRERAISGIISDPTGKPINDIELALVEIVNPYDGQIEHSLLFSEILCFVRPDEKGVIRLSGLPPQKIANLIPRNRRSELPVIHVATSDDLISEKMIAKNAPRASLVYPYSISKFDVVTKSGVGDPATGNVGTAKQNVKAKRRSVRTVTVRVVNAADGRGVSAVAVGFDTKVDDFQISPGMQVTDRQGTAKLEIPQSAVDVYIGGRRFGFVTPYNRITTSTQEFTPTVERSYWVRTIAAGPNDETVTFELMPVAPLRITVQKEDGTPAMAELKITRPNWPGWQMPLIYSDERGRAEISVRPVLFEVEITATTDSGLKGSLIRNLSKDFDQPDTVTVMVK